jgi:hypothetical protein
MGMAENWQERVARALSEVGDVVLLNPRRHDWDDSWDQAAADPRFSEQVSWELDMLEAADLVVMYLAPGTRSPVSLLELGLCARSGKLRVCCPPGFWRRGNVEMVCQRHRVPLYETLDELTAGLRASLLPASRPAGGRDPREASPGASPVLARAVGGRDALGFRWRAGGRAVAERTAA